MSEPTYGHTNSGMPVHRHLWDFNHAETAYQKFNAKVAVALTKNIGTMTCFWIFCFLCLLVLPAVLPVGIFPSFMLFMTSFRYELFMTWLLSTCFQLTLLPALMVGQNLSNAAADARAAKTFEDAEVITDKLDLETAGGLQVLNDRLKHLEEILEERK